MKNKMDVFYDHRLVGTIARLQDRYAFQYSDEWLQNGFSISPFSLPMKKQLFIPSKNNFNGMFGVFEDSLPDSWGRLLLDRYLREKFPNTEQDELFRFMFLSENGMGALTYRPHQEIPENEEFPDLDEYQWQTESVLSSREADVETLFTYGGSSGGARPKALVKFENQDWIIKFQSRFDVENAGKTEYDYALACKEIGIDIPEVKLFNSRYFGIRRFDRKNGKKIHMISAAALLEADYRSPCLDYNELFKLTRIVTNDDKKDRNNLFLRMCFNVFAHNLDDHAKNFSFLYEEDLKRYVLSPAYDMTFSNTYYGEHTTSVNGKGKDITENDLLEVGKKAGIPEKDAKQMVNHVKETVLCRLSAYLE